ncbi:MAG TPA: Crp/Fnr family transcriptional regulator [Crenotrichaceae bacterium]|nr:Crp/Fnr family transcriptional regulator [Crenotrichaceae bacterium]
MLTQTEPEHRDLWEQHFPSFAEAQDPAVNDFMHSAKLINVSDRQMVFSVGDPCENYLLLLEGQIRVQLIAETGREVMLYTVSSGDSCVLTTSCLMEHKPYPAEAFTDADIRAFLISEADFNKALEKSDFFRKYVFSNISNRLSSVIHRMEDVVLNPIEARLAKYLLSIDEPVIKKTHQELASEMGTAREVISRHLRQLKISGWVQLSRGKITLIDRSALEKLIISE